MKKKRSKNKDPNINQKSFYFEDSQKKITILKMNNEKKTQKK